MARRRSGLASLLSKISSVQVEESDNEDRKEREAGEEVRDCWRDEDRLLHLDRVLKLELDDMESTEPRRFGR